MQLSYCDLSLNDLGLKGCAVTSGGDRLEGRNYRKLEDALAVAQRANKTLEVKNIHAKMSYIN